VRLTSFVGAFSHRSGGNLRFYPESGQSVDMPLMSAKCRKRTSRSFSIHEPIQKGSIWRGGVSGLFWCSARGSDAVSQNSARFDLGEIEGDGKIGAALVPESAAPISSRPQYVPEVGAAIASLNCDVQWTESWTQDGPRRNFAECDFFATQ